MNIFLKSKYVLRTAFFLFIMSLMMGCEGCEGPDTLIISNEGSDEVTVMIDGADAQGEFVDRIYKVNDSVAEIPVDLIARGDGFEEAVAFTRNRAPFFRNPTSFRENKDVIYVSFEDEISLDFTVWIVDVDGVNTVNNRTNETLDALAFADERWVEERVGLRVGDVRIVDSTNDPDANDLRDCRPCDDTHFDNLANDIGFDDNRINIYLIRKAGDSMWSRYFGIAERPGDQVVMGMYTGSDDLLMHELAHNFGLRHVDDGINADDDSNFDSNNVATSTPAAFTTRLYFSEGQTFRCHSLPDGAINAVYQARPGGYTFDCLHTDDNTRCPPVKRRIWRDGNFGPDQVITLN